MKYWIRSSQYVFVALGAIVLCQCAQKEVKRQLTKSVETSGQSYAREMQAQSPFKKVSLSWHDATELMKERNTDYKRAVATQIEAEHKNGLVKDFTYEMKKSLKSTATQTLNPKEIAKAINNPMAELPKQLKSLTDLKNISHSLKQKEWTRVGQSVKAQKTTRKEMVKLHVLFRQEKVLEEQQALLKNYDKLVVGNVSLEKLLKKKRVNYEKQREKWLNSVRDFFNAEYYDVDFKGSKNRLTLYRNVSDPSFHQWQRWRTLGRSEELSKLLSKKHNDEKPVVPGVQTLKKSLGITDLQHKLADHQEIDTELREEVRTMLKTWRELKLAQAKIVALKSKHADLPSSDKVTVQMIEEHFKIYQFLQSEIKLVSFFWMIDEKCWS